MEFESRTARFSSMLNERELSRIGNLVDLEVGLEVVDTQKHCLLDLLVSLLLQLHLVASEAASEEDLAVAIVEIVEASVAAVAVLEALEEEEALDTKEAIGLEVVEVVSVAGLLHLTHPPGLAVPVVALVDLDSFLPVE